MGTCDVGLGSTGVAWDWHIWCVFGGLDLWIGCLVGLSGVGLGVCVQRRHVAA